MANPSNSPTDIKVYPIPGTGVEVRATFHQANSLPATYARFQVATDQNFTTVVYDSGQVPITPIPDGAEGVMVFPFIPSSANTYYYRLCFWDNSNYTQTTWLVWNGTTVTESSIQTVRLYPNGDHSYVGAYFDPYPTTPATKYDKIDDVTADDDTTYIYASDKDTTANPDEFFTLQDFNPPADFKRIVSIDLVARSKFSVLTGRQAGFCYIRDSTHKKYRSLSLANSTGWETVTKNYTTDWNDQPWTVATINDAHLECYLSNNSSSTTKLYVTQLYVQVNFVNYVFTFTPPGNNKLDIGFPVVNDVQVSNDKDKYTFIVNVTDSYTKPPIVSLSIEGNAFLMDLQSQTGTMPYIYTFTKTISLERGDYEYHIEVGNVWTVLIDSTRYLHVDYTLNENPKIECFIDDRKINTWNHILTENVLPDVPEIEFDTDADIQSYEILVRFVKSDIKHYVMSIQNKTKIPGGYHIRAKEVAQQDLAQTVSFSAQVINSLSLLKSILPRYTFYGYLKETIYLQAFSNERAADIIRRVLILNNSIGYVRNKKIYLYSLDNKNISFKIDVSDPQVNYEVDYSSIVNKVREYYITKAYPVPENVFTNYDAANWGGSVANAGQTTNGILPASGSLYCLKGNGTIYRSVNFLWSDFDQLNLNWCPDTATTLEIRLETDASNYRKYTRTFSGQKGAGFVLTSAQATDVVTKTITFQSKYIHRVEGIVTNACAVKVYLKLSGSIVYSTDWQTITDSFSFTFANVLCDTIALSFTNLYVVGTTFGVNCTSLTIEEYKQQYQITGTRESANWHGVYKDSAIIGRVGDTYEYSGKITLGPVPPLGAYERYEVTRNYCYVRYIDGQTGVETRFYFSANIVFENGTANAIFSVVLPYKSQFSARVFYEIEIYKLVVTSTGEWVWIYAPYTWQESYNLWDNVSIPLSQFTNVGSPSNQVNTIRLIAAGDNYYDTLYFVKNNPIPRYVEAENEESIQKGVRFQERKTDGWSSKESALAFANAFVKYFGEPAVSYSKQMSIKTDINIGDMVECGGKILPVYRIVYNLNAGQMTVFVGRSVTDTLEWLKETARKIEAIEKTIL